MINIYTIFIDNKTSKNQNITSTVSATAATSGVERLTVQDKHSRERSPVVVANPKNKDNSKVVRGFDVQSNDGKTILQSNCIYKCIFIFIYFIYSYRY